MEGAGAVVAKLAVPAIAIARDPSVEMSRQEVNPRHQKQPGKQLPAAQRHSNPRPSVCSGVNAAGWIDRLHQAHGFFSIYLRKARRNTGVVKVQ
jgi:hypothetical protein